MVPPPVASLLSLQQAGDAACCGGEDQKCQTSVQQSLSCEQSWLRNLLERGVRASLPPLPWKQHASSLRSGSLV